MRRFVVAASLVLVAAVWENPEEKRSFEAKLETGNELKTKNPKKKPTQISTLSKDGSQVAGASGPVRRVFPQKEPSVCLAFLSCCGRTDLLERTLYGAVRNANSSLCGDVI